MTFSDIWADLLSPSSRDGEIRRRIRPDAPADLYLQVQRPGGTRALRVEADFQDDAAELPVLPSTAGVELRWDGAGSGRPALNVILRVSSFADLFDRLIDDVADAAADSTSRSEAADSVVGRIRRWQSFLRDIPVGLSPEAQQGLHGELDAMQSLVAPAVGWAEAVGGWTGGDRANQDFALGRRAVEVKTTVGRDHQSLQIASERQLDPTGLDVLIILATSLDRREGSGTTLPQAVESVRQGLISDASASALFEDKLHDAGYLDRHQGLYQTGYTLRSRKLFAVRGDFPRLTECDCPDGVANVRYSIAVSSLDAFVVTEPDVQQMLGGDHV